jgi:hypothetical protein
MGDFFEEHRDMYEMYKISPELTCTCDEVHTCQQCYEEYQADYQININKDVHHPDQY